MLLQLYDIIQPGVVTWNKVHKKFNRMKKFMEKLENCNYAVDLGRKQKYSLVGIAGERIIAKIAEITVNVNDFMIISLIMIVGMVLIIVMKAIIVMIVTIKLMVIIIMAVIMS